MDNFLLPHPYQEFSPVRLNFVFLAVLLTEQITLLLNRDIKSEILFQVSERQPHCKFRNRVRDGQIIGNYSLTSDLIALL